MIAVPALLPTAVFLIPLVRASKAVRPTPTLSVAELKVPDVE